MSNNFAMMLIKFYGKKFHDANCKCLLNKQYHFNYPHMMDGSSCCTFDLAKFFSNFEQNNFYLMLLMNAII